MKTGNSFFKLHTMIAIFVCTVVAMSLLVTDMLISNNVGKQTQDSLSDHAMEIARITAYSPTVVDALTGKRPAQEIQDYAQKLCQISNTRFIVVMDMNRLRKSHPTLAKIGTVYEEHDADKAFAGQETTSIEKGSLGKSLRAFVPVYNDSGRQIGVVLVGIMLDSVYQAIANSRSSIYAGIGIGLLVGLTGAVLLARHIKKIMFGLEPFSIARLVEERSAMLQSTREGMIAVDQDGRITLVNDAALQIFAKAGITGPFLGQLVDECVPNTRLQSVFKTGKPELDQEQDMNGITVMTNRTPVSIDGKIIGAIATFRDKTELRNLAEQLTGVRNYAESLRAQTHEFMNKLHVILGMIRMGVYDQLTDYVNQIAHQYQAKVGSIVKKIKDPVLAGFLLGKQSQAKEAGAILVLTEDSFLPESANPETVHEMITIIGNLIDNALDAVENTPDKLIQTGLYYENGQLVIVVNDSGSGLSEQDKDHIFLKGYSTKGDYRGLGLYLVTCSLERIGGRITVASQPGQGTQFTVRSPYTAKEDVAW
ncbi:Sensor histidine kinase MalK [Propionispora sp. 2/2-37]|uniref:DcuS/MalK family sensor histidine kinase n=1 Tax=Propionispora sp. 2/2-37 TaxID=1677858 RepID=UPI0006BB596E|nr:DcuS/MalK family sensor histidine kinase [Propionispora sp. 2/2-37]CUH97304.1 Sensor histidine kinase MalK [Propionispora sp. 2/2-37]